MVLLLLLFNPMNATSGYLVHKKIISLANQRVQDLVSQSKIESDWGGHWTRVCTHRNTQHDTHTEREGLLSHLMMGPRSCSGECPPLALSSWPRTKGQGQEESCIQQHSRDFSFIPAHSQICVEFVIFQLPNNRIGEQSSKTMFTKVFLEITFQHWNKADRS